MIMIQGKIDTNLKRKIRDRKTETLSENSQNKRQQNKKYTKIKMNSYYKRWMLYVFLKLAKLAKKDFKNCPVHSRERKI